MYIRNQSLAANVATVVSRCTCTAGVPNIPVQGNKLESRTRFYFYFFPFENHHTAIILYYVVRATRLCDVTRYLKRLYTCCKPT